MITHYDLFAGIGGFSIALEEVFTDDTIRHVFCEWESFPTAVLRQHWPEGEFYGDIADLVTHTSGTRTRLETQDAGSQGRDAGDQPERKVVRQGKREVNAKRTTTGFRTLDNTAADAQHKGLEGGSQEGAGHDGFSNRERPDQAQNWTIVTGGFPCQPFSAAGRRKGTADDRYQWPNMFEVIRNTKPDWVIAENVRGLVTWNEGLVLETVCADLESEGYEVQPFIIPAVAVGAPHRRDRVWIIAHAKNAGQFAGLGLERQSIEEATEQRSQDSHAADTTRQRRDSGTSKGLETTETERRQSQQADQRHHFPDWGRNWKEVAFETCDDSLDDGLPRDLGGIPYSAAKWRRESLKAYGNAIVPQVAINIMQAIKEAQL